MTTTSRVVSFFFAGILLGAGCTTSSPGSGGGSGGVSGSGGSTVGGSGGDNGGQPDAAGSGGNGSGGDNGAAGMDGGVPPAGNSSGLPRTSTVSALTDDQKGTLCDWWNAKQGGYGQSADCGGGDTESDDTDQDDCLSGLDDCDSAMVSDFEDCANAVGANLCMFDTAPACTTLFTCFNAGGDDANP
ncbi:MAG TPA: hypothetical protein VGL59_00415 [Polyangia bacterium]